MDPRSKIVSGPVLGAVGVLVLGALVPGCAARRELTILSDPPGALVRLDDSVVGTTPYRTSFDAYGGRRVTVYREGYRTAVKRFDLVPPWYARFPFDFVSEVLLPFGWHDPHEVRLVLVPEGGRVTETDLSEVLARAQSLRLAEPSGPRPIPTPPAKSLTPEPAPR